MNGEYPRGACSGGTALGTLILGRRAIAGRYEGDVNCIGFAKYGTGLQVGEHYHEPERGAIFDDPRLMAVPSVGEAHLVGEASPKDFVLHLAVVHPENPWMLIHRPRHRWSVREYPLWKYLDDVEGNGNVPVFFRLSDAHLGLLEMHPGILENGMGSMLAGLGPEMRALYERS